MAYTPIMTIKLYTMQALARHLGTSYGYMRQVMLKLNKGTLTPPWRGFRFITIGKGKRSTWFAYPEEVELELVTTPEEEAGGEG